MDPSTAMVIVEGAKAILSAYFNLMKLAGKSEEEIEEMFQTQKSLLKVNDPSGLEDTNAS